MKTVIQRRSTKPRGYWTDETIISELKIAISEVGHFLTKDELLATKRGGLFEAIQEHGGFKKFRKLMGYDLLRKPDGYWTYENTTDELKNVITKIGHFPTDTEMRMMKRTDLSNQIAKWGGSNHFRELLGYDIIQKSDGYWTFERTLVELKEIHKQADYFLTRDELNAMKRGDLEGAINTNGGRDIFRELLGYEPIQKPDGYWTYESTLKELENIVAEIGHFPTHEELYAMKKSSVIRAMDMYGGSAIFREKMGYDLIQKPNGYWTDEVIITELKKIEEELKHFPIQKEIRGMWRMDLEGAMQTHGGRNKFRKLLGHDLLKKPTGYWTYEVILSELKKTVIKIGHFPTREELKELKEHALVGAIEQSRGLLHFREALGYSISLYQQYCAESASYNSRRGLNTERIVKSILIGWCKQNGYPLPTYHKKLATNNVIEFVCGVGKTIGIDATNTKSPSGDAIRRKYRKKDYHKYVDELWIVVFSNVFGEQNYRKFNEESPDNVRVMSIDTFLEELDISTDEHLHSKIENYKNCTFRTKDEFVKRHLNKNLAEYVQ